jgi:glycosyltransferase involved in cell wall biosynthesis
MKVIVPRLVDEANVNAQNLNARNLLSRFGRESCEWRCVCYDKPDPAVSSNPAVTVTRLARWRAWPWHLALFYQQSADAIFYPGIEWPDRTGLQWRDRMHRSIPVIATFEGLVGGSERQERLSRIAGHPVYCHPASRDVSDRIDDVLHRANHIVAISPFLAKVARELYGDKCSALPLGVDLAKFAPSGCPKSGLNKKVLGIGTVYPRKRPELFLSLAERFRDVQFRWIGGGEQRAALIAETARRGLHNLDFPGPFTHAQIAAEMQTADVFIMPSHAEGAPKATQEAAASGLPCIVFGHYEAPSVVDGRNGYVVWSDDELGRRLGELLQDPILREKMGACGREMAAAWDWSVVAPQWEQALLGIIGSLRGSLATKRAL